MSGWPIVKIGEVVRLDLERTPIDPSASYAMVGVLSFGRGLFDREPVVNGSTSYKHFYRLKSEHFVMSQLFGWEGALALSSESFADKFVSPQFPTFICDRARLDRRFLGWYTRRPAFWADLGKRASGMGDRRRTLSPASLFDCEIPLPPLAEQRRIVGRLWRFDEEIGAAITLREQRDVELNALEDAAANAVFSARALQTCDRRPLGECAEIRSGVTLGRVLKGATVRLPYLRVANVQAGYLDLTTVKTVEILGHEAEKWLLRDGDILLTEGGDWDKLGRGTVWRGELAACIHQNHIFRLRLDRRDFDPDFLAAYIGSPIGRAYFQAASKQTTNLASINQRQLRAFPVPVPTLATQRDIVARLRALRAQADAVRSLARASRNALEMLLPAVLNKAFDGGV